MAGRYISTNATTGAPAGENTSLAGTELVPISGNQVTLISTIAAYIRTLTQTLTNKTINLASNTLTGTTAEFNTALSDGNFAVNVFKTIAVSGQSDVVADSDTDTLTLAAGSNVTITTNASTDTVTVAASGGNAFGTVAVSGQSDVVADAAPDTLTLAAGSNVTITTNAGTDTVTIAASGGNAFGTVAVSGQSDVVADAAPDTLTLAAGSGITLTTNAGTDTVTIANSGGAFVLNTNTTPVGNVGAGEDDLITYSVPANTLDTNSQYIHFVMGGTFAASINNKRIRVKIGSTTLFDTGVLAITAAGDWNAEGYIVRTGSATQKCLVEFTSNETGLTGSADYVDATEDLTTTLTFKATGEATDNNDVIQKFLIVEKGGGNASGDFVGPGSSTDNAVVRFDGTTGKLGQNSVMTVDDSGTVNIPTAQTYNINGSAHTHAESVITFTDITTNNASTSAHGYLKKLSNAASEFMNGVGSWVTPPGTELDYVEFTSNVSPTATTEGTANTVVTGSSVAYDGSTVVIIEFVSPLARPDTGAAARTQSFWLYEDGSSIGKIGEQTTPAANSAAQPVHCSRRMTPTNASHTYSIRASVSAGTGLIVGGAGGVGNNMPGYIRIIKK